MDVLLYAALAAAYLAVGVAVAAVMYRLSRLPRAFQHIDLGAFALLWPIFVLGQLLNLPLVLLGIVVSYFAGKRPKALPGNDSHNGKPTLPKGGSSNYPPGGAAGNLE